MITSHSAGRGGCDERTWDDVMSPSSCYLVRGLQLRNEKRSLQELALKFVKGLRHVPYEAALQYFRLFSLTHRRIRGDLISMFKITHGLLEFPVESNVTHPTRKGQRGHTYKFYQQRCFTRRRHHTFSIRAVPFRNKLPAEIVNISSTKSFLDANWQSPLNKVYI